VPDLPFAGIRVLDFTRVVAGPYATLMLADLGAEVIKIERPEVGDDSREFAPPSVNGQGTYFAGLNRGKKSVVLDLGQEMDRDLARKLAADADVLVENFRPGFMERVGLGHVRLRESNPRLIYCSITGFGPDGPYRDRAAYDVTVAALGGLMSITGHPGQAPVKTGVASLDVASGLYGFGGIATALYQRERTGKGKLVEVSILEVQVANLINAASAYLLAGHVMGPMGTSHVSIVPYQAFAASDGWVVIGALNDPMFARLCGALGHPDWTGDPRFVTNPARVANRDMIVELIDQVVRTRPIDEWVEALGSAGVAVAPVNTIDRVMADPQIQHAGLVREVDDPRLGRIRAIATPIHFDRQDLHAAGRVPLLGEDTREVLDPLTPAVPRQPS